MPLAADAGSGATVLRDLIKLGLRAAFCAATMLAYVLALLPGDPHVFQNDKSNHLLAFGTLAVLARLGWTRASALTIGAGLIAFGGFIEFSQALPIVGRDASAADVVADAMAAAGGLAAGALGLLAIRRVQPA